MFENIGVPPSPWRFNHCHPVDVNVVRFSDVVKFIFSKLFNGNLRFKYICKNFVLNCVLIMQYKTKLIALLISAKKSLFGVCDINKNQFC